MKTSIIAAAAVLAALVAAPASAQQAAQAPASASAAMSVETTTIGQIIANEKAKAILEKELPQITEFYDQIREMTLAQVVPMSQGVIDDAKLKAIQAELDKLAHGNH